VSDLRSGLLAEYSLDGDGRDGSGRGYHGTVHGATPAPDRFGRPGGALRFDGIEDYVEIAPPPPLSPDALSVSIWANFEPRDFRGWTNCLVAQDDGNDEDQSRRVFQLSLDQGRLVWHRMIGARDPVYGRRMRPGRWYHVAAVQQRGLHRLYVDGELRDEVTHRFWTNPDQPLQIGRKGTDEPYFFFRGALDDLRIYDRALQAEEIQALLHDGGWQPAADPVVAAADPLSGRWGQQGVVFLDLRWDTHDRVTGRIMAGTPGNMAPIETGHFDRVSAQLRLEGAATDHRTGAPGRFRIEGLLDDDQLCVVARFRDYQGNFVLTRAGARLRPNRRSLRSQLGALAYRVRRRFLSGRVP
jgi:hypothetical protein